MFNWLKSLFRKEEKSLLTAAAKFEIDVHKRGLAGMYEVWEMNNEIDQIGEHIQFLMQQRQQMVSDRANLIESINKQRKAFDLELLNDEGVVESEEPAEDENYALEP